MSYVKYLRDVLGEGFKEFVIKFSDQDENINAYVEKFKLLRSRNRVKGVEADIDYWIKKDFNTFKTFVDSFKDSEIRSRREITKDAYSKNVVAENDEYVIIKINSAEEMYVLGTGTVWCVASGMKVTARGHYEHYTKDSNFYVAIKKNLGEMEMLDIAHVINEKKQAMIYPYWDKIAIQVNENYTTFYNTGDFERNLSDKELSKVNLPKYKFKYQFKVPESWTLNEDGTYDVEGYVNITESMLVDGKFPVKFGHVTRYFFCQYLKNLVSLEGAPKSVGGDFSCMGCDSLTSLDFVPKVVSGNFYCGDCPELKLSELDKIPLSYRDRVKHTMEESTFYNWNKTYNKLND